ncbi:hypothetical protein [Edwardsiella tarda]|uniref:hypothetical protein n=1 Tax=Edwardsiella tarda TaxID=636 RepID=UPI003D2F06BF
MCNHTFAGMMYHIYKATGLLKEVRQKNGEIKTEQRHELMKIANFLSHQSFFNERYNDLIQLIDPRGLYSIDEHYEIFYKYEQLYNALMHIPVFTKHNNEIVCYQYLKYIMCPIITLDIFKTLDPADDEHFYYHIHRFLTSKYCPTKESNIKIVCSGVRKYLRSYIKELNLPDCLDIEPIYGFIRNIKSDEIQRDRSIDQKIKIILNSLKESKLAIKNDNEIYRKIQKIKNAYTVLLIILTFEHLTSSLSILALHYHNLIDNGIRENSLMELLSQYIYSSGYCDESLRELALLLAKNSVSHICTSVEEDVLFGITSLEEIIFNLTTIARYTAIDFLELIIIFDESKNQDLIKPYIKTLHLLSLIRDGELIKAYNFVKCMSQEKLPIGYITSAIENIKLALRIKLELKGIRNGSLTNSSNILLASQGVYTDYVFPSLAEKNISITSYGNNLTIMRSIKLYNSLVWKLSNDLSNDSLDVYQQSIHGLLYKIERALKKINKVLNNTSTDIDHETLAKLIIEKNILTKPETNDNLIGFLEKCTLYNCILDLDRIVYYLMAPRENITNIINLRGTGERSIIMRKMIAKSILLVNEIRN